MVLLSDKLYNQTRDIKLGRIKPSPGFLMLSEWLAKQYGIKMLNAEFSRLPNLKETYRLYIILDSTEDYNKMHSGRFKMNKSYQETIARNFARIALKTKLAEPTTLKNVYVVYNDFSEEAKTDANWKADKKFRIILKDKYVDVWDVLAMFSSTVVFFYTESQISKNKRDGNTKRIREDYFELLKKYDEMKYYTKKNIIVKFDSKENLDKNYEGSLFYYAR
jgi:hypothetical protein